MAGIDKTYCTLEQYKIIRKWWINTRDQQVKDLGHAIWLSPLWVYKNDKNEHYSYAENITRDQLDQQLDIKEWNGDTNDDRVIWNTSLKEDLWLSKYCDIDFIQGRLKEQYPEDWIGFTHKNEIDFNDPPFIAEIMLSNGSPIYFFKKHDNGDVEWVEKVIFYGTTFLLKVYHEAIRMAWLRTRTSDIEYILYNYYGIVVKYNVSKQETYIISKGKDEEKGIITVDESEFIVPEFKHSYDISEIESYDDEEIFMSYDHEAFDITQYKNHSRDKIKRYIILLPDYVSKLIKK